MMNYNTVRPRKKRKPINQVNFSESYNELSKKNISNGDVKIDLRKIGN